jgi:N-acetylneuraminic acid mutarotase
MMSWFSLKPKSMSILLSVLVIAIVGLLLISVPVAASGVGVWTGTTSYPTTILSQSCVVSGAYVYCVGGFNPSITSVVYFGKLSSSGVGTWKSTTSYPTTIGEQSCVVSGGYVYCVGGNPGVSPYITSAVYFAKLSSSGVGTWKVTTSYPTIIEDQSCVVSGGYVYCVGGYNGAYTNSVYFASLSSSGVGTWKSTTSYPTIIGYQSCVVSGGYVYCVGGFTGSVYLGAVYSASLSTSGVGTWKSTTSYPTTIGQQSCVVSGGYVYCVGGYSTGSATTSAVYFGKLSSSGVGTWKSTTGYPTTIVDQSCVASASHVYCVAGGTTAVTYTSAVYFASV